MFLSSANSSAVDFEQNTERISLGKRLVPSRPFIKWAGGKRRLLEQYSPFLPSPTQFNYYFEPFLGGGALFFHLRPVKAFLADLNADLINCYRVVRDSPEELIEVLSKHKTSEQYFYRIRELIPENLTPLQRASRFIYLNKTCYNGLYRVNKQGQFNVPYGKYKKPLICDSEVIRTASESLKEIHLSVSSFEKTVEKAQKRDFIYLDPPYVPLSPTASFTSYTSSNFTEQDQAKLAQLVRTLDKKGCLVMLSNSDTKLVRTLYQDFSIITVNCPRSINSNPFARGNVTELLIRNY
ncbi:MAG: DNA adenine methylase [Acidobacteria bacterium]|nr:DNA adenine methylase [Acidobacteriota bacterium]